MNLTRRHLAAVLFFAACFVACLAVASPPASSKESPPRADDSFESRLLALFDENHYFLSKTYPALRKLYADQFQQSHEADFRRAFGENYYKMADWFAAHPAVKEELFTAIDPEHDDVAGALRLFGQLVEKFPASLPNYANAAIAVAVVWDDPRRAGIQDYVGDQRRTKSILPKGRAGALENYQYLLDAEDVMQGRARFLPWEFLALVVNHSTPIDERHWAVRNYLAKRISIGRCYHDVPYDTIMLETGSRTARLNGQQYTLPNLRQFGGVCVNQADFASRVAKSLGVPAARVGGESRTLEGHAWVMWVELLAVSETSIRFELQSHGRYRGDRYYVGTLSDPQTGRRITDRQLELRLQTVGRNPQNKRHAALLMKSYPLFCVRRELDAYARLRFLDRVITLSPGNEAAWLAVARLSKEGQLTRRHRKTLMATLNNLFTVFARFPDFTWEVFDDLIAFEDRPPQRGQLYDRLIAMYVAADRPDLACKAVLKYADGPAADQQKQAIIDALAATIVAFPDEGRYVPPMLDKLEALLKNVPGGSDQLLDFYQAFLPKVPRARGNRPSEYCMKLYRRAIKQFQEAGRSQQAQFWQGELAKMEGSKRDIR